jgi:membrane protease YdiL (CAAX protease family)
MFQRYLTFYKPGVQLLAFSILFFMCSILFSLLAITIVPKFLPDVDFMNLASNPDLKNAAQIQTLKILQIAQQFFILLLPALLFGYLSYPYAMKFLGFNKVKSIHIFLGIVLILVTIPFMAVLEHINKMVPLSPTIKLAEEQAQKMIAAFLSGNSSLHFIFSFFMFAILPAFAEELFFRSGVQHVILTGWFRLKPFMAIAITAVIFSLFHFQMEGFLPRFFAGFVLGSAYYLSSSIWLSILMHAINNALSLVFYFKFSEIEKQQSDWLNSNFWWLGILCAILIYFIFFQFYKTKNTYTILEVDKDDVPSNLNEYD